jgi:hypothetical protein
MNLRKPLLAALLLALAALPATAQNNTGAGGGGLNAVAPIQMFKSAGAHQQLTITSGAVVTLTVPLTATMAAFTVETASIRMLDDGPNPTTTLGNVWPIGPAYYGGSLAQLQAMKFIAISTSATLDVLYYTNN